MRDSADSLYSQLAGELAGRIEQGLYRAGDKLPGVRELSRTRGVSPATAVAAYRQLELDGVVEARPRSGFYVRERRRLSLPEPRSKQFQEGPTLVRGQEAVLRLLEASRRPDVVQLGAAVPDVAYLPARALERALASAAHHPRVRSCAYEFGAGFPDLRRQLARLMAGSGCLLSPEDLVITNGCQEALFLCLKLLTQPGDVIALESPTYYGLLQVVDSLGLKALEIPSDPRQGLSLDALRLACEQWPLKACVVMPNFANPLGSCMPDDHKRALVALACHYDLALIEDDIYGGLAFNGPRPACLKAFDDDDRVFHCASFSKSLSPGLRVGWVASRGHSRNLAYEKYLLNSAAPTVTQIAAAQLLESGRYERHLRDMRVALARSVDRMQVMLDRHFPAETRVTRPQGGFVLWLELPAAVDARELADAALEEGISIAPGPLFSTTGKYRNHIRLSCAIDWNERAEQAIVRLGDLVKARLR